MMEEYNSTNMKTEGTKIAFRLASMEEGQRLVETNSHYYDSLTQMDIDWRAMKEGATLEELKDLAKSQVMDFNDKDYVVIARAVAIIEDRLNMIGCKLPLPEKIVFVKTTMKDEGEASAYTSRNIIFINRNILDHFSLRMKGMEDLVNLITHELFHCITRNSPEFRKAMYDLIGFTIMDKDLEFPENIRSWIMANPDVEHIDNYAEFTIGGVKKKCELVALYSNSYQEAVAMMGEGARFFYHVMPMLVPIDEPDNAIDIDEAKDFWNKVGSNTEYVLAPEEILAVNFADAVVYGLNRKNYETPQLIEGIINTLKHFQ